MIIPVTVSIVLLLFPIKVTSLEQSQLIDDFDIPTFVLQQGYPIENHTVVTEDGYILTLFRIPRDRNGNQNTNPLLLNHAMLVSAEIYLILGPEKSLAFVLADHGYDVWLMNSRGTLHSKKHKILSTSEKRFWNFSWNEIGVYDIPAVVDYILQTTSKSSLHYIGHSQGTTSLFVMGSERPEYNKKIKVMVALAPGARYKYIKNVFLKTVAPYYRLLEMFPLGIFFLACSQWEQIRTLTDYLKIYELPPPFLTTNKLRKLLKLLCLQPERFSLICTFFAKMYSPIMDLVDLPKVLSGTPSSLSVKQPLHYAQLIATGNFQKYDWGTKKNLSKYGTKKPPLYNLRNVTFPVAIFWGASDEFVSVEDLQYLRKELPKIVEDFRIPLDSFTHVDFVLGKNLQQLMYYRILIILDKFQ